MLRLHTTPFLRFLVPYLIGILNQLYGFPLPTLVAWGICVISSLLFLGLTLVYRRQAQRYSPYWQMGFSDVFLFCLATIALNLSNPFNSKQHLSNYFSETNLQLSGILVDVPERSLKHMKLQVCVNQLLSDTGRVPVTGKVLVYLPLKDCRDTILVNSPLVFSAKLLPIQAPKNPGEFNYQIYAHDQGIAYTCFPKSSHFYILPALATLSLKQVALQIKQSIIYRFNHCGLTASSAAICNALITGYDADIDKPLMDAFAATGTLHILSVSGLHVGLIFMLLTGLFNVVDPFKRYSIFRFVSITLLLWAFTFISGFEAPILRAVIMFNLLGLGQILYPYRQKNQLNIVFCSAFILLVFNPYIIRNGGFLLSYLAVIGLICLYPPFKAMYSPKNGLLKNIWSSVAVSISATIGTFPISLYYFHFFPLWFIPCNLIVVPLSYLIMILIPGLFIFPTVFAPLINAVVYFLEVFNTFFAELSFREVFSTSLNLVETYLLYGLILALFFAWRFKQYGYFLSALGICLVWQLVNVYATYKSEPLQFIVYHHRRSVAYGWLNTTRATINCSDSLFYNQRILPHLKPLETKRAAFNVLTSPSFCFINCDATTPFQQLVALKPTHLLISHNTIPDSTFLSQVNLRTIIIHPHNNSKTRQQLMQLCYTFGIECWDLDARGFYQCQQQL